MRLDGVRYGGGCCEINGCAVRSVRFVCVVLAESGVVLRGERWGAGGVVVTFVP